MLLVICASCRAALRISGGEFEDTRLVSEGSEFWPDKYPCPFCDRAATAYRPSDISPDALRLMTVYELGPVEAYAAFQGLGMPHERELSPDLLDSLLREKPVRRVVSAPVPGSRHLLIDHLELWDGTKVFFGAGAVGAVVFRVRSPPHYTK